MFGEGIFGPKRELHEDQKLRPEKLHDIHTTPNINQLHDTHTSPNINQLHDFHTSPNINQLHYFHTSPNINQLHDFHSSQNINQLTQTRTGQLAHMEDSIQNFVWEPERGHMDDFRVERTSSIKMWS